MMLTEFEAGPLFSYRDDHTLSLSSQLGRETTDFANSICEPLTELAHDVERIMWRAGTWGGEGARQSRGRRPQPTPP